MPFDDRKLAAPLKVILMLGFLFLLGLYVGARFGFLQRLFSFSESDFAVFFLPVKLFLLLLPFIFIYIMVTVFINYYFTAIGYIARLLLIAAGLAMFYTGLMIV